MPGPFAKVRIRTSICSADMVQLQERALYLKTKGCEVLPKPFDLNDLLTLLERTAGKPE